MKPIIKIFIVILFVSILVIVNINCNQGGSSDPGKIYSVSGTLNKGGATTNIWVVLADGADITHIVSSVEITGSGAFSFQHLEEGDYYLLGYSYASTPYVGTWGWTGTFPFQASVFHIPASRTGMDFTLYTFPWPF